MATAKTEHGMLFSQRGGSIELIDSNVTYPGLGGGSWVMDGSSGSFHCRQSRLIAEPGNNYTLFEESIQGVVLTHCVVENLEVADKLKVPMTVRNSHFNPPLDFGKQTWIQNCVEAGCDRRITNCLQNASTGGVQCYCAKAGLHFVEATNIDDGYFVDATNIDDGNNCIEATTTLLDMQTADLDLTIYKPLPSPPQTMSLRSRGDTEVEYSFMLFEYDQDMQLRQQTSDIKQAGSNGLHLEILPPKPSGFSAQSSPCEGWSPSFGQWKGKGIANTP